MRTSLSLLAVILLVVSGMAFAANLPMRTLSGVYTCMACQEAHTNGTTSQCATYGHQYALQLGDGRYVTFINNDHAQELVKGGGRTNFPITVTGAYDRVAGTIEVSSYVIDGIKTVWSDEQHGMVRLDKSANSANATLANR